MRYTKKIPPLNRGYPTTGEKVHNGSLAIVIFTTYESCTDRRPMTLRRQLSLVLPFGCRAILVVLLLQL
jgi:hypothetical protein